MPQINYISIVSENGRVSSLGIYDGALKVIGVLHHCSYIQPNSIEDAEELAAWLNNWIDEQKAIQEAGERVKAEMSTWDMEGLES